MVYYRKYRPQKISELDSQDVRIKLKSVLAPSAPTFLQVPHAFLFTGPKGLGKTSTARIVAKVINCTGRKDTTGKDIEPCNKCDACVSITSGTNMDILEIDAASNRGIDEMRDLKEKIKLSPLSAKKKIYIIDEVHMLTTEAFNALLKTLEEPPPHAVFILCTTEMHKIPATILSRCFHIGFRLATEEELVNSFERIVKEENLKVDKKVLKEIAKLSDGGFRDGAKLLEEIVSLSDGKEVTTEFLESHFHTSSIANLTQTLLKSLIKKDVKESLKIVSSLTEQGVDTKFFLTELIGELHKALLKKIGVETQSNLDVELSTLELKNLLELFAKAIGETKFAVVSQLPLELAIIEWCEDSGNQQQSVIGSDEKLIKETVKEAIKEDVSLSSLRKQVGEISKIKAMYGEDPSAGSGQAKKEKGEPAVVSALHYKASGNHTPEWISAFWKEIIAEMKQHNHMIAGVLNSCKVVSYDRKILVIEALSTFHKEKLNEAKTLKVLEEISHKLAGNPVIVTIELKN